MRSLLALLTALGLTLVPSTVPATEEGGDEHARVRGVTISTPGMGKDWGSDAMVTTLREVRDLGANWVTIHPYASIGDGADRGARTLAEGQVRPWQGADSGADSLHLTRPIREARALGLKVLIKPHLAYWGTRFSWRGEIDFQSEESFERFFRSYEAWLLQLVELCEGADAFVVGTELDKTLGHDKEWRRVIESVRAKTKMPLTYAANWPEYRRVPFWDVLDVIGIQAYFPISEAATSDREALARGWRKVMGELREFSESQHRRIVFTEIGYNCSRHAGTRPWEYETEASPEAREIQEACLQVALESIEAESSVVGSFLWKWFPDSRVRPRNFDLREPRIRKLIASIWQSGE